MKVTLWETVGHPVELIYCEWLQSRSDGPVPTPAEVRKRIDDERDQTLWRLHPHLHRMPYNSVSEKVEPGPFEQEVRKRFEEGISMGVPMSETIQFVWLFEGVSVSWREQAVRHQIGHKFGGCAGFDQIPDLASSSFWVQSMRQKDMGKFAEKGQYYVPETVASKPDVHADYDGMMLRMQSMYNHLVQSGVPLEDARNVLPMGCTHRLVWAMNWTSMTSLLSRRSCWIAQLGMWEPVIFQMIDELAKKVDPYFARLGNPPCIGKDDKYHNCPYQLENLEYIRGTDPHHPCPLWTYNQRADFTKVAKEVKESGEVPTWEPVRDNGDKEEVCNRPLVKKTVEAEVADRDARTARYVTLWRRDPKTGERLPVA